MDALRETYSGALLSAGETSKAVLVAESGLANAPADAISKERAAVLLKLADACRLDGQIPRAIEYYRLVQPDFPEYFYSGRPGLARSYRAMGETEEARKLYQQSAKIAGSRFTDLVNRPLSKPAFDAGARMLYIPNDYGNPRRMVQRFNECADFEMKTGNWESAEHHLRTLLGFQEQLFGAADPDFGPTLARLQVVEGKLGTESDSHELTSSEHAYYRALSYADLGDMPGYQRELNSLNEQYSRLADLPSLRFLANALVVVNSNDFGPFPNLRGPLLESELLSDRLAAAAILLRAGEAKRASDEIDVVKEYWLALDRKPIDGPLGWIQLWQALACMALDRDDEAIKWSRAAENYFEIDRRDRLVDLWPQIATSRLLGREINPHWAGN